MHRYDHGRPGDQAPGFSMNVMFKMPEAVLEISNEKLSSLQRERKRDCDSHLRLGTRKNGCLARSDNQSNSKQKSLVLNTSSQQRKLNEL